MYLCHMFKWVWIFGVVLTLSSCGEKVQDATQNISMDKPVDLIPEDKMILVLTDVHLLEGAIGFNVPRPASIMPNIMNGEQIRQIPAVTDQKAMPYYDIFKKHGVTRLQFEESFRWYSMDTEKFTLMYDEVINELVRRQAEEQGTPVAQPVEPDN